MTESAGVSFATADASVLYPFIAVYFLIAFIPALALAISEWRRHR